MSLFQVSWMSGNASFVGFAIRRAKNPINQIVNHFLVQRWKKISLSKHTKHFDSKHIGDCWSSESYWNEKLIFPSLRRVQWVENSLALKLCFSFLQTRSALSQNNSLCHVCLLRRFPKFWFRGETLQKNFSFEKKLRKKSLKKNHHSLANHGFKGGEIVYIQSFIIVGQSETDTLAQLDYLPTLLPF